MFFRGFLVLCVSYVFLWGIVVCWIILFIVMMFVEIYVVEGNLEEVDGVMNY